MLQRRCSREFSLLPSWKRLFHSQGRLGPKLDHLSLSPFDRSQNHRMVEAGRDLWRSPCPTLLTKRISHDQVKMNLCLALQQISPGACNSSSILLQNTSLIFPFQTYFLTSGLIFSITCLSHRLLLLELSSIRISCLFGTGQFTVDGLFFFLNFSGSSLGYSLKLTAALVKSTILWHEMSQTHWQIHTSVPFLQKT